MIIINNNNNNNSNNGKNNNRYILFLFEYHLTLSGPYPTLLFYSGLRHTILFFKGRPLRQERVKIQTCETTPCPFVI